MSKSVLLLVLQLLLSPVVTYRNQVEEEDTDSWEEAKGYEECQGFFRDLPKPKALKKICRERECARGLNMTIDSPGCGYSERILYSGNWITTHIDLNDTEFGYREAYFRLGGYRSGKTNDRKQPVDMALPVIKKWYLDEKYNIISATMSFYIPAPYQKNPPASLDPEVEVEQWDDITIYSRAYGGNRDDPEFMEQFDFLRDALAREEIVTYSGMMMTAGYTRPGYGKQRREVMLVGENHDIM